MSEPHVLPQYGANSNSPVLLHMQRRAPCCYCYTQRLSDITRFVSVANPYISTGLLPCLARGSRPIQVLP
jgi:hypothetical protein